MDSDNERQTERQVYWADQPAMEWQVNRLRRLIERYVGEIKRHRELAESLDNKKRIKLFFDPLWAMAPDLTRMEAEIAIDIMKYYPENPKMILDPASIDHPEAVRSLKAKLDEVEARAQGKK